MALTPGTRLGAYEVTAQIGEGGMGQVFRATDTKLKRQVAIKILPPSVAADHDRLARFQREAEVLASLNHPNIAGIYGLEESSGATALVMELVEGEDLSAIIARGPIPIADALPLAKQIADALEAAHEQGIIHRDLKPANIKIKGVTPTRVPDGRLAPTRSAPDVAGATVKVLDFGLAKAMAPGAESGTGSNLANSPTMASPAMTAMGMILGTAAYMSPEQAKGRAVDKRADIWAFGVVLYEMLSGRRAFEGEDVSDLLVAVLSKDVDLGALPAGTPRRLRALLRDCLIRDPKQRLRDIGDARRVLDKIIAGAPDDAVTPAPAAAVIDPTWRRVLPWALAGVLGVALVVALWPSAPWRAAPAPVDAMQFTVAPAENSTLAAAIHFAISPDGRHLAFVAGPSGGQPMLWVRPLGTLAARALPGTELATQPFWSPDGRSLAFFAAGKLKKVDLSGGAPAVLCDVTATAGGTWNRNNVIVFGSQGALQRVDAADGMPTPVTALDKGETSHNWPSFLPDGEHVLYLAMRGGARELRVGSLGSTETTSLGAVESHGVYASGHLLFTRGGTLMAQPFDAATRQRSGEPFPVAESLPVFATGRGAFSVSTTGVLAYYRGGTLPVSRLTWMDRSGKTLGVVGDAGTYGNLSLSPDERRVAVSMTAGSPANRDIWLVDLARADTATRLTFDPAVEADPIWSPDGSQIFFNSNRDGAYNSGVLRSTDGAGQDVPVVKTERLVDSPDWSHDGRSIVFTGGQRQTSNDLWVVPLSGDRKPSVLLETPFNEDSPAFSPDDRWLAYNSDASGRFEVYVRSFAAGGGQFKISRDGGWAPRWRGDGKEMFFLALDGKMMAVDVTLGKDLQASVPRALFPTTLLKTTDRHTYAVTKDGQRFLIRVSDPQQAATPITVVVNWPALAKE